MIELIQELESASSLLNDAIQKYVTACYAIKNFYAQTTELSGVPRALSERVANELVSANSYEMNVKRARSAISQARNCSPTATPIHVLPTEVLSRIFYFVVGERPCQTRVDDNNGTYIHFPKYPDILSHICSRWRHVVLGLPALWSHIDLVSFHSRSQGFSSRAEACATRARHLPLDIHIRQTLEGVSDASIYPVLSAFANRTRSLELAIPHSETIGSSFKALVLQYLLGRCTPGIFTKLAITDRVDNVPKLIVTQTNLQGAFGLDTIWLPLAKERFETVLLAVTVLRLDGIYPLWTSQAYQGLVELHLTCSTGVKVKLTPAQLYGILDNNPGLRVLEFGLEIIPPTNSDTFNPPMFHLAHLEVLSLRLPGPVELKVLPSFITPGTNPLQMRIYYREEFSVLAEEHELVKFFKRSNITRLYVEGDGSCPPVGELVNLLPNLYTLVLDGFDDLDEDEPRLSQNPTHQALSTSSAPSLHELYLIECAIHLDSLKHVAQKYSIQELIFWETGVYPGDDGSLSDYKIRVELSGLCPSLKFVPDEDPNPVEHWD